MYFPSHGALGTVPRILPVLRFALLGLMSTHFFVNQRLELRGVEADRTVELCLRSDDFGIDI